MVSVTTHLEPAISILKIGTYVLEVSELYSVLQRLRISDDNPKSHLCSSLMVDVLQIPHSNAWRFLGEEMRRWKHHVLIIEMNPSSEDIDEFKKGLGRWKTNFLGLFSSNRMTFDLHIVRRIEL